MAINELRTPLRLENQYAGRIEYSKRWLAEYLTSEEDFKRIHP